MPNNLTIQGGKSTGAPEGWDADKHGPCGTICVLYRDGERGPEMQTAWNFQQSEMIALADGGAFYLTLPGLAHPVISLAVYDSKGEPVGDLKFPDQVEGAGAPGFPMVEGFQLQIARRALIGMLDQVDGIAVAGESLILGAGGRTAGWIDWPDATAAVSRAIVAADPDEALEAIAKLFKVDAELLRGESSVSEALGGSGTFMRDATRDAIRDAHFSIEKLVAGEAKRHLDNAGDQGERLEGAYEAALGEIERQATERENGPDMGDPDQSGQLWVKGTFNVKEIIEAAIQGYHAADKADEDGQPERTVQVPVTTLEALAAQAQVEKTLGATMGQRRVDLGDSNFDLGMKGTWHPVDIPDIHYRTIDLGVGGSLASEKIKGMPVGGIGTDMPADRARSVQLQAARQELDGHLDMWTIYASPTDFPGKHVARLHRVTRTGSEPTSTCYIADTLEDCRDAMHAHGIGKLECLGRDDEDEPQIVESWV